MAWVAYLAPVPDGCHAQRALIDCMCATTPSRDKEDENNVCRLRKDKVFVYFT
jgi:hypothetical protein